NTFFDTAERDDVPTESGILYRLQCVFDLFLGNAHFVIKLFERLFRVAQNIVAAAVSAAEWLKAFGAEWPKNCSCGERQLQLCDFRDVAVMQLWQVPVMCSNRSVHRSFQF